MGTGDVAETSEAEAQPRETDEGMEAIDPSASDSSSTSDGMQDDSALREERFAGGSRMAVRDRAFAAANRRASAVAATSTSTTA